MQSSALERRRLQIYDDLMGDPHNPARAGELWNQSRIDAQLAELEKIKALVVISGGWAWHFMSPPGHAEVKTQHDHKDIDVFVRPTDFGALRSAFIADGYQRARTQYDDPSGDFYRFVKYLKDGKVVFDVFLEEVPFIEAGGFRVVEPKRLLSFYGKKHTSEECLAVQEARKLVAQNLDPVGRSELVYPG